MSLGLILKKHARHNILRTYFFVRCLAALFGKPFNPEAIRQCRESCDNLHEELNEKIATLKKTSEGENEGAFDDEIRHLEVYPRYIL